MKNFTAPQRPWTLAPARASSVLKSSVLTLCSPYSSSR
jgi:hypothetical protein